MTRLRSERGQTLILSVVFMTVLLGMAAAVLDVGSWYRAQRATQAAADAAALAGAQKLPYDTGAATGLASEYATKNGGGIASVEFPAGKFAANDTIRVGFERPAAGFFTKIFGIDSVTVHAKASARAANISAARWVAPIVVNEKHPMLVCRPRPCFGTGTELEYYHLKGDGSGKGAEPKPGGPKDTSDGAGAFGFVNLNPADPNPGSSTLEEWITRGYSGYMKLGTYESRPGNPFSSTNVDDALASRIGTEILFPVYRKLTETGSTAQYDIIGWVGFHLTGLELHGSSEKLFGYFTQVIWEGIQTETGGEPDFGVRSIALVE